MDRFYNIAVQTYSKSGFIPVVENCFAYMFTNLGNTPADINGMIVYPNALPNQLGDSRTVMAHKDDLFKGNLKLSIHIPIGANPLIEIVQMFYEK